MMYCFQELIDSPYCIFSSSNCYIVSNLFVGDRVQEGVLIFELIVIFIYLCIRIYGTYATIFIFRYIISAV